ncbi:MAG: TIR domain-containing protein [Lachnoclostridium sp.]|nr:TIR domain-containing protein [Lachnoclostridium sp.]
METICYKSFAFISYSHRDMGVAKWLQRKLEGFKLPTEIHNEIDAESRYLRPVFRDQSDLNTGILSDELRKNLEESKYLILICSRNSAQSQWVSDEAKAFVEMGRLDRIIPVIIPDGQTNERELFPIFLREYFSLNPDKELLGVNIGEIGREKALIRVVSRMIDVSFDSLWKRHQRQKRMRALSYSTASAIVLIATYLFAIPVTVHISVELQPSHLPTPGYIRLNINGGEYTSEAENPSFDKIHLPGYKRLSDIKLNTDAQFFVPVDTTILTGLGLTRDINLKMVRDNSFALFKGIVYDEDMNPLQGVEVTLAGFKTTTASNGEFTITLPLQSQRIEQTITLSKSGYQPILREDETPGTQLKFIMHKQ